jgi:hypothetical protein
MTICTIVFIVLLFVVAFLYSKHSQNKSKEEIKEKIRAYGARLVQIIEESKAIINKSKNLDTIISRFDVILEKADELIRVAEQHEYPTITNPPPTEIKAFYLQERERFIYDFINGAVEIEKEKAIAVTRRSTKAAIIDKAIITVLDGKRALRSQEKKDALNDLEESLRALLSKEDAE